MKPADGTRIETKKERAARLKLEQELRRRERAGQERRRQLEPTVLKRYLRGMKKRFGRGSRISGRWVGGPQYRRVRIDLKLKGKADTVLLFEPNYIVYDQAEESLEKVNGRAVIA